MTVSTFKLLQEKYPSLESQNVIFDKTMLYFRLGKNKNKIMIVRGCYSLKDYIKEIKRKNRVKEYFIINEC